jgi:dinuclear metal center YbgI/SA1388 family protein
MKLKELVSFFNEIAPFSIQESYDNSGLQTGDPEMEISGGIICLDVTPDVLEEAIDHKMNLIISHHPLIFGGIDSITGKNHTERVLLKAIKNDIAILAVHTNLDAVIPGVNDKIANKLGLVNRKILDPMQDKLLKLAFFVPVNSAETVRSVVFGAGAGVIGEYDYCSFNVEGVGTFRASENANPHVGEIGKVHNEKEIRIEIILPEYMQAKVVSALLSAHPYEEVAYDLYPLKNIHGRIGMGIVGDMEEEMEEYDFLNGLKRIFNTGCVRYTQLSGKKIKKVALCGGSGSFLLKKAISVGADVFVSADFKYHQFFDAENQILIADIGHYESEQFTKELFYELVTKKFPKFALRLSEVNTNPINYL